MKWENLKQELCPKCGRRLGEERNGFECIGCGFFITKSKFVDLTGDFDRRSFKSEMEGYGF